MAKKPKEFKWKYAVVQEGMVYYRRVIPQALREAHDLPLIIKKATGISVSDGAEAIAMITKLNALQEREWKQLEIGITAKSSLEKALEFLKVSQFNTLSEDEFETQDGVIRDFFKQLWEKGKLPPEYALLAKMGDFRDLSTIPTVLSVASVSYTHLTLPTIYSV